jgi:hypothetical protein
MSREAGTKNNSKINPVLFFIIVYSNQNLPILILQLSYIKVAKRRRDCESGGIDVLKRYIIRLSLTAFFLLLFSLRLVDRSVWVGAWEDPLESGWKTTGLTLEELSTETWLKLNDRGLSVSELKVTAQKIQEKLHMRLRTNTISGTQDNYTFISFTGVRPDQTTVTVTIQSCREPGRPETQMGIYTSRVNPGANLRPYLEGLQGALRKLSPAGNTAVIMSSKWPGKLDQASFKKLCRRVFQKLEAKLVEVGYPNAEMSTYKGYTTALRRAPDRFTQTNVDFSAKYDPQSRYTQVQLATPGGEEGV